MNIFSIIELLVSVGTGHHRGSREGEGEVHRGRGEVVLVVRVQV